MGSIRKVVATWCVSLSVATSCYADGKAHDFYFQENQQRFFAQPQNARMFGMAGSTSLTAANSLSTVNNPGGLGLMTTARFQLPTGITRSRVGATVVGAILRTSSMQGRSTARHLWGQERGGCLTMVISA